MTSSNLGLPLISPASPPAHAHTAHHHLSAHDASRRYSIAPAHEVQLSASRIASQQRRSLHHVDVRPGQTGRTLVGTVDQRFQLTELDQDSRNPSTAAPTNDPGGRKGMEPTIQVASFPHTPTRRSRHRRPKGARHHDHVDFPESGPAFQTTPFVRLRILLDLTPPSPPSHRRRRRYRCPWHHGGGMSWHQAARTRPHRTPHVHPLRA